MIDYSTSVLRWRENRDKVFRNGFFYKEGALLKAHQKFEKDDPEMLALCSFLVKEYAYLLETDAKYLENMIEDTTPGPCHMNLSPEHDFGVPHGLWDWDPKNPDVIIDEVTGTTFPNENYPETGILETSWGKPQKFTYYTGKSITYNRFTVNASFSGKVRFYKVQYMTEAAYNLAFLYHLTGKWAYAEKAAQILLRFALVYPYWLAHGMYGDIADMDPKTVGPDPKDLPLPRTCLPPNEPLHELHVGYWSLGRATASGQEGGGFLLPVSITYMMIENAVSSKGIPLLTDDQKQRIEKDILLEGISLVVNDPKLNNKSCSNRFAAMAVGMITGVMEYIEFGRSGFKQIVEDWYLADGSTSESAGYSMMVMSSMWIAAELLEGYTGIDGKDNPMPVYTWNKYRAIWKGMYDTLLQNAQYPPSADSRPQTTLSTLYCKILAYRFERPEYWALLDKNTDTGTRKRSMYHILPNGAKRTDDVNMIFKDLFFPDFGQGYLRIGDDNKKGTLVLYATDWGIHHHLDSLNLFYFWNGVEWLSDLGYLWDQPEKHMNVRTPAHNTVVIDEEEQVKQGRGGFLHHMAVLPKIKLMDVSSNAYPNAEQYRRAVITVEHSDTLHYIIDLFHVKGGNTQDYIMHGPSEDFYLINANKEVYDHKMPYLLEKPYLLTAEKNMAIHWTENGNAGFDVFLPQNDQSKEKFILAEGWGQRGTTDIGTKLPYLVRRHEGEDATTFITVMSASTGQSCVKSFSHWCTDDKKSIAIEVMLESGGKDLILYQFEPKNSSLNTPSGHIKFDGTFAMQKSGCVNKQVVLYGGGNFSCYGNTYSTDWCTKTGNIIKYDEEGFVIDIPYEDAKQWVGRFVYVEDSLRKTGYCVLKVTQAGDLARITTWDDTGEGFAFIGGSTWRMENIEILYPTD